MDSMNELFAMTEENREVLERIVKLSNELTLLHEREAEIVNELHRITADVNLFKVSKNDSIESLGLSSRATNLINRYNRIDSRYGSIRTIDDLANVPKYAFCHIVGFGEHTAEEITKKMQERGYEDFELSTRKH